MTNLTTVSSYASGCDFQKAAVDILYVMLVWTTDLRAGNLFTLTTQAGANGTNESVLCTWCDPLWTVCIGQTQQLSEMARKG